MYRRVSPASVPSPALSGIVLLGIAAGALAAGPEGLCRQFQATARSASSTPRTGARRRHGTGFAGPHGMARHARRPHRLRQRRRRLDRHRHRHGDRPGRPDDRSRQIPARPRACTPDGGTLLVGVYGDDRVAFVDVATAESRRDRRRSPKPHTIAMRPDGKVAYVASQEPGNFALVVVDVAGTRGAAPCRARQAAARRRVRLRRQGAVLHAGRRECACRCSIRRRTRSSRRFPTGASPHIANSSAVRPAGTAVVQGPGELLLFDPETNAPLRSIAVGKQPHWDGDRGRQDQSTSPTKAANDFSIVDLATGKVTSDPRGQGAAQGRRAARLRPQLRPGPRKVSIANFAFTPATLTIAAGETVTWSNDDGAPHGLAYKDGAKGDRCAAPGAKFARTFDKPGSFDYLCAVHPYMSGKVVVQAP